MDMNRVGQPGDSLAARTRHNIPSRGLRGLVSAGLLLIGLTLAAGGLGAPTPAALADPEMGANAAACAGALTADFAARDRLPQAKTPPEQWYTRNWNGGWGPSAAALPAVAVPAGCDPVAWQRERVVAVARKYLGLAYRHHHVPGWTPPAALVGAAAAGAGLDCSNFTAWVYNYGLGVRFTSDVQDQADGASAPGRRLAAGEPFAPGDLLFIKAQDGSQISHVVLYVDEHTVIDSHDPFGGVTEHPMAGWYLTHFSHARRLIE